MWAAGFRKRDEARPMIPNPNWEQGLLGPQDIIKALENASLPRALLALYVGLPLSIPPTCLSVYLWLSKHPTSEFYPQTSLYTFLGRVSLSRLLRLGLRFLCNSSRTWLILLPERGFAPMCTLSPFFRPCFLMASMCHGVMSKSPLGCWEKPTIGGIWTKDYRLAVAQIAKCQTVSSQN